MVALPDHEVYQHQDIGMLLKTEYSATDSSSITKSCSSNNNSKPHMNKTGFIFFWGFGFWCLLSYHSCNTCIGSI